MEALQVPFLKVSLLGVPQIERSGIILKLRRRKTLALLAYLLVTGRSQSRNMLAAQFWPEQDSSSARASLRRELSRLRGQVGKDVLVVEREQVGVNPQVNLWLDVREFQNRVNRVREHDHEALEGCKICQEALNEAAALYQGDFMAGFSLPDSPAFDEWQFFQSESLRRSLAEALQMLIQCLSGQGEYERAIEHARQWLALDPLHEPAHRELMQLYAWAGQQAAALRQYQECRRILKEELDIEPDAATTLLYEAIRSRKITPPTAAQVPPQPASPLYTPLARDGLADVSPTRAQPLTLSLAPPVERFLEAETTPREARNPVFVGRERELAQLDHQLNLALAGQGRVALLVGEAGQGKTALLHRFAWQAQETYPDLIVAGGNCNAYTGFGDPYLPFREILGLLTGDIEAQILSGVLHPDHVRRLWDIMPNTIRTLAETAPDLIDTFIPAQSYHNRAAAFALLDNEWLDRLQTAKRSAIQQNALFEQYTRLVQALARQTPLLLVLDDLQWADPGSANLLFNLCRHLGDHRILIAGAYRPDDVAMGRDGSAHPLARVVQELRRDFGEILIDLSQAEGRAFVDALLDSQPNHLSTAFRETLFRQTEGHPLFTIELLQSMQERGDLVQDASGYWIEASTLDWDTLPARVEGAIGVRIKHLEAPLQELLQVASVEGEEFTAEAAARVLNLDAPEAIRRLSGDLDKTYRLVQAQGIRRVNGRRLSRYRFRHILIQRYLYHSLDEVERVYQHEAVGNALEAIYGEQASEAAVQLARHFAAAEMPERAAIYLERAGDRAWRAAAVEEAYRYYQAALDQWPDADPPGRARLLRKAGECQWVTGHLEDALESFTQGYALFEALDDWQAAGAVQRLVGRLYWEMGDRVRSLHHYHRALEILEDLPESTELAWAISSISQMHMLASEHDQAIAWGQRALALARKLGADQVVAHAKNNLGTIYLNRGDIERGRKMLLESARLALDLGLPHDVSRARNNLGEGLAGLGRYEEARAVFMDLYAYAEQVHAIISAGGSLVELARLDWITGRWGESLARRDQIQEWIERGQSIAYLEVIASTLFGRQYNDLGQPESARRVLEQIREKVRGFDELQIAGPYLGQRVRAFALLDMHAAAEQAVEELLSLVEQKPFADRYVEMALLYSTYCMASNPSSGAVRLAQACLQVMDRPHGLLDNPFTAAISEEGKAVMALMNDSPQAAVEHFPRSAAHWQQLNRPYDRMRALKGLGQAWLRLEQPDPAQDAFNRANDLARALASQLEDPVLKTTFLHSPLLKGLELQKAVQHLPGFPHQA